MAEITSLSNVTKSNIGVNDYLVVANKSTKKARKLSAQSLFPTLTTTGTSSESLYTSVTNRNQINLKGLKSADSKITVATTSNNLVLTFPVLSNLLKDFSLSSLIFFSCLACWSNISSILILCLKASRYVTS